MSDSGEKRLLALRPWMEEKSEIILRAILSSIDTGILVTDLDHVALACNVRFGEIFGIDIAKVVDSDVQAVRNMVRERIDDVVAWNQNLEDVYSQPESPFADQLLLRNPFCVLNRASLPLRDSTGEVFGRLWTFQIATEQYQQGLRDAILHEMSLLFDPDPRQVYEFIVDRTGMHYGSVAILSIQKGDFMEFRAAGGPNPAAKEIPGNPLGESFCQFCLQANRPTIIQDASQDPKYEACMPLKFGLTRYAGIPLMAPDGTSIGTFCILDDRSDEPLGEDDLRFLSVLSMRISSELEREAQLLELKSDLAEAQAQMIQNEKLATAGTLSAAIAHDIRNIVSALTLDLGTVENPAEIEALRTHLDRFNVLAHRLLSYAKPRESHLEPVVIAESLHRVRDLLRRHFEVAGVAFTMNIEEDLSDVHADPARLDHLFVNLCLNALQVLGKGGSIRVSAYASGQLVVVEVQDDGPGIDLESAGNAFEPFRSSRSDGFGLGLYSCRQIVQESGGTLKMSSVPGKGTTFRMEFPAL